MRVLETDRTLLEPLCPEHADGMFAGLSNPRLYTFIADEPPASVGALAERYARLESRRSPRGDQLWLNWVVLTKPERRARGYIQATVSGATAYIAYVLFEDAWSQGLARESVDRMLAELRHAYSVRHVIATTDPRNRRSVRLLERLGFALSVTRVGAEWVHGVLADEAEYVLQLQA